MVLLVGVVLCVFYWIVGVLCVCFFCVLVNCALCVWYVVFVLFVCGFCEFEMLMAPGAISLVGFVWCFLAIKFACLCCD